ncbi:MAG: type II toxin-antitoxin system PemK/MazF family toxin [Myxococcales bacterium]|nr:type II toxin-antitoxin system PemK/MazF family toxin [Myxococcales bacterium]
MRRGDIYWINLEPASPPEFGKVRPAVIVSNSEQNLVLSSVVVLPVSSRPPEIWPLRIELPVSISKAKQSFAVVPGIRQVSKSRLLEPIVSLPELTLKALTDALVLYLGE